MPRKLILAAALIAGTSYFFSDGVTTDGIGHLVWKGSGVGLLALWAALGARSADRMAARGWRSRSMRPPMSRSSSGWCRVRRRSSSGIC